MPSPGEISIFTVSASSQCHDGQRGHVVVSGSYGGEYNAFHAGKWGIRGVVLNDAGIGKERAGVRGLDYLDRVGLAAATADCMTCHIADGDHMLAHGRISHVNRAAAALGCLVGQSVRDCAELMKAGTPAKGELPPITGGKRYTIRDVPGEPKVICLDAAPMLEEADAGSIAITGSHAALFRFQPDDVIRPQLHAVFFSDGGVGLDNAGVRRLPELDKRGIPAGAIAAMSAPIGDARGIYQDGVFSHVNATAEALGARPGQRVHDFVESLLVAARKQAAR
ncbi:hypothetical protein DWF00_19600 [Bosea caraganae]|uniref:Uncharacterized protein n=1 Tax=Bosea caraganae TaxID=2763117 RepID=A0A370KXJ8_9HYPH|nr:hypothetical protein [Bosea caraganae]RDJ19690.1 hypothetical protein DWE98_28365 [Bosea caraganae]RDJ24334.1 hypothetical protein DWF00_19600 [Bosea caraganae]